MVNKFFGQRFSLLLSGGLVYGSVAAAIASSSAIAQVVPDTTVNTRVTVENGNFTITEGTTAGSNLFHSFSDFSIPTGRTATFDNAGNIANIFSRVTGDSISSVDGTLRTNGGANLFLLNPNGILFGPNANLDIGGSFVATTADRVLFPGDRSFSASQPTAAPLLSFNMPLGLQFGTNPGAITVTGPGNQVTAVPGFGLTDDSNRPLGLALTNDHSLALLGGEIRFPGGNVTTLPGTLDVGSVGSNQVVSVAPNGTRLSFGYDSVTDFQDITLSQSASVQTFGGPQSEFNVRARNLTVTDGSVLGSTTGATLQSLGGNITVETTESIIVSGATPALPSTISVSLGTSPELLRPDTILSTASVNLKTRLLQVIDGAAITTANVGPGQSGDIVIDAQAVEVIGTNAFGLFSSTISTATLPTSTGLAGDLNIQTDTLLLFGGGVVSSATFSPGPAGSVTIKANRIELADPDQRRTRPITGINAASVFSGGAGGSVSIETGYLGIRDGLQVSTSSDGAGSAGNVQIRADTIEVVGSSPTVTLFGVPPATLEPIQGSLISATSLGTGSAGSVVIEADSISVRDGGEISVSNVVAGNAGNLEISAPILALDQGELLATSSSGNEGNIVVRSDRLTLRNNSAISTNAIGSATGGNIDITTSLLAAIPQENSDISANSTSNFGGQITISTGSLFGLQFQPTLTDQSDITAASDLGTQFSGTVSIDEVIIDTSSGLLTVDVDAVDPAEQIAKGCTATGSRFVVTGRGGIPPSANGYSDGDRPWNDLRDLSALMRSSGSEVSPPPQATESGRTPTAPAAIIEATGWQQAARGQTLVMIASADGHQGRSGVYHVCSTPSLRRPSPT